MIMQSPVTIRQRRTLTPLSPGIIYAGSTTETEESCIDSTDSCNDSAESWNDPAESRIDSAQLRIDSAGSWNHPADLLKELAESGTESEEPINVLCESRYDPCESRN